MPKSLFILFLTSYAYSWALYDELAITPSLSHDKFLYYSPQVVKQNYQAYSPKLQFFILKNFTDSLGVIVDLEGHYDLGLQSKIIINQQNSYNAHSFGAEGRLMAVYHLSKKEGVRIALGAGAGAFFLKLIDPEDPVAYLPYGGVYYPVARLYKDYCFNSYQGRWCLEAAQVDTKPYATFKGIAYRLEHTLWLQSTSSYSYGLKSYYHFWNLDLPFLGRSQTIDRHTIGMGIEFNFK